MNRLQENRVKIIRAKSSVGLGRKTAISLANSSGRALFLTLTFLSASTVLRAQSTSYTNGEDNTGTIDTTGGISLTITSGAATQSGVISGNGGVTVNPLSTQTGTLSLTATNTYQGDTTISNGTLAVSGTGAALTQTLHINVGQSSGDNGALLISGGAVVNGALIYAGNNSGSTGNVTVTGTGSRFQTTLGDVIAGLNGTGTLTISNGGVVSDYRGYVGAFSGSVGTATVDGPGSTWSNTAYMIVGFQGNGTLTVSNGGTVTGSLVALALVGGQGTVQLNSGGILAASQISAGSGTAALNVNNGILRANTASTDFITGFTGTEINIQGGGGTIDNNGHNITINAPLTGTGSLTFTGTATTIMSGSSSYSGGTTISGGILEATGTNSALGTGTVTVQSGGELFLNNSITLANNITISGTGATSNSGAINSAGTNFTNQTVSGTVSLAGNTLVTNNAANTQLVLNAVNLGSNTLTFGSGGLFVLNGNISGSGGLIIAGLQMRINGGQNSFTGTTDVLSGQLFLQDTTGTAISGNLTIEDGAFVEDHRSNQLSANTVLTINGSGGMSFIASGSGTQIETIAGISGSSTSSLTADNFGAVSNLNLTLAGTGSYSYAGRIADFPIDTATLTLIKAGSGTQILSGTNTYTGGTQLNGGTLAVSADNNLGASTSSLTFSGGKLETTAGFTSSRSVVLNSTGTFQVDTGTLAMTGSITGAGGLTKTGAGQLTLSGSNSYSGGTFINVGTLALGSAGSIATSSGVTLSGTATFDITAGSQTIQDLTGLSGTVNLGSSRLTLGTGNSTTFGGVIFGSGGGITKIGTGSLTLNGTSTYTGDTIIDHGTLAVSGTSAAITSSGATMYVGQNNGDNGTLTVSNGGQVSNGSGYIGYNSGSTGSVTVTGTGSSWTTNELLVGAFGTGTLTISNGGQVSDNYGYIGFFSGSTGTVTVTGTGSSWINNFYLYVGESGTGTLTISNGGQVSDGTALIGDGSGSTGTVTVDGTGSSWTNTSNLFVGEFGTGTLTVSNGGQVSDSSGDIGVGASSTGTVTVDGTGSSWTNTGNLYVGESGTGTLTVSNGGQVSDIFGYIGVGTGSTGTVTVDGTGSTWTNTGNLYVGESGTGTLTVSTSGTVTADVLKLAVLGGAQGTVNLNSGGVLATGQVMAGSGTATFNFNGGILRATGTSNDFISNFTGTEVQLLSGGGTIDNNGFDITVNSPLTGTGSLTSTGTGELILTGSNTYSGGTILQSGTLVIANSSALGTGALTTIDPTVVYTNGVNVANPIIMEADTTLEVDNADSATQTGTISESGTVASVTKIGTGTLTLRGTNSYSGGTEIAAGILQVDAISSGLGTGKVTVDSGATLALFNKASLDNAITISGTGAGGQGAIFGFGGGAAVQESITGTVTLAADATVGNGGLNSDLQLGPIDLQNHTLTIGTGSGNFALNGDITGSGGLTFNAFGSVAITGGNNTFTGLTDVLSGSNLGLADTVGTAISGDLRIQDGGYVQDDNGNQLAGTTTLMLNGSGEFAIAPQGTISLSETIAGLSGTSTSSVVTSIGAGASGPTLNTLTLSGTGTYSYAGQITDDTVDSPSASLALIKSGSGTQILSGNNTYHGGTTIESGTLAISGTGATLGTSGSNITVGLNNGDNGTFVVSAGGHATDGDGTIGGGSGSTGSATVDGTGSTWTNNGLLTVGDQGNGSLTVENGGTVTTGVNGINNVGLLVSGGAVSGTVTVSGTGSSVTVGSGGTGDMVLGNAGPALLVIANGGLVTDNSAFLAEGNSTSSGTVDVTGSGSTWTNNDTITIGEAGTGTVMVENGGSISASTIIIADAAGSAGLLQIGNNNQGGALTVTSIQFGSGTGTIEFDQTDTTTLGANISGAGNLIQKGSGTTILSGNSTFTGGTTIDAGTLVVGSTTALGAGDVTLNNGVLTTTGTGTGIQIAVGGNYTQAAGTTLFLNLYSASNYDSLSLTGTGVASLNGTLHLNLVGGFAPGQGQSFTVLASNETVNGTFSSIVTNLPSIGVRTNYTNDVTVLFQKSFIGLPGLTLTPNQTAVATYIDTFDQHITSPAFANLVGALNTASGTPATLQNAFNQLSPLNFANFASSTAFNNASFTVQGLDGYLANHRGADGTFVGSDGGLDYSGLAVNDPNVDTGLQSVRSRLLAWSPAPSTGLLSDSSSLLPGGMDMKNVTVNNSPTNLWNVFLTGNVILAQDFANNSAGIPYADTTTGAAQIGADYKITPHFLAGVAFGYGHTHANLDTIGSNANVNTYSPAVYLSYSNSGWYANALGSYGFSSYSQNRSVSIGAFNGTAHSSPGGNQIIGDLDGGYDFHKGNWTFGPTLGLQYTHLNVDGYTETGLPGADLTVNSNQADSLRSHLGGRVSYAVKSGTSIFTPHLSASWQHEFMDQSRGITSQFSDVGAGSFVVNTPNSSRDSALADVGVDAQINNTITIFSDYSVQAGQSNYFGQSIQAGLKIGF